MPLHKKALDICDRIKILYSGIIQAVYMLVCHCVITLHNLNSKSLHLLPKLELSRIHK